MLIGIISDTHIKKNTTSFINMLKNYFDEVNMIIHAGDYINDDVVKILNDNFKFIGVWGNADNTAVKNLLNEKEIINIESYRIGIFHGHGKVSTTLDRASEKFKNDNVDIVIFGHSHQPLIKTKNGILMLNPGSLTAKRREKWPSYIILKINANHLDIYLKFLT